MVPRRLDLPFHGELVFTWYAPYCIQETGTGGYLPLKTRMNSSCHCICQSLRNLQKSK